MKRYTSTIRRGVSYLTRIVNIRYTREQEREADYLGLYAAQQAGYNVNAAPFAWERFAVATPGGMYDHFLKDHPPTPERFVRVQKTIEEIRQGRTLQQAWFGEPADIQVASNSGNSSSITIPAYIPSTSSAPVDMAIPATLLSSLPSTDTAPEKKPSTKTYASLVQYDGPKVKSGVTLEAEFIDDGSGSGEGKVVYPGNRYFLAGSWTTLPPGQVERPKLIEKKALNALRLLADTPLITSRFVDNDTLLECLHGETAFFGQRKGECQDNHGNKYHLVFRP